MLTQSIISNKQHSSSSQTGSGLNGSSYSQSLFKQRTNQAKRIYRPKPVNKITPATLSNKAQSSFHPDNSQNIIDLFTKTSSNLNAGEQNGNGQQLDQQQQLDIRLMSTLQIIESSQEDINHPNHDSFRANGDSSVKIANERTKIVKEPQARKNRYAKSSINGVASRQLNSGNIGSGQSVSATRAGYIVKQPKIEIKQNGTHSGGILISTDAQSMRNIKSQREFIIKNQRNSSSNQSSLINIAKIDGFQKDRGATKSQNSSRSNPPAVRGAQSTNSDTSTILNVNRSSVNNFNQPNLNGTQSSSNILCVASSTSTGFTNEFLVKQKQRQQKDLEVQLMMNRIKLLEQEEEKIKRQIDITKKKAIEIMQNKELNEQKMRQKLKQEEELGTELERQREKNLQMRDQIRREVQQKQIEMQQRIVNEARFRKRMRKENEVKIKQDSEIAVLENKEKKDKIKESEQKIREKLERFREQRERMCQGYLEQKIEAENEKFEKADQLLKMLEQKELMIIERLKHTQKHEDKAKQMLVDAIIQTTKGKKERVRMGNQAMTTSELFNINNGSKTVR